MPLKCKTCPFNLNKDGQHRDNQLVSRIQFQVLTEAAQICHHPRLNQNPETHLCRGAYDYQQEIANRLTSTQNKQC